MSIINSSLPKISYNHYEIRKKNQSTKNPLPKIKKPDFPQLTFLLPPDEKRNKLNKHKK
ncbi:MAG: hypothetical protein WAW86_09455 [Gammaproteobacteria bacterium]